VATEEFYVDAARGQLPAYAFIEPNMVPPHSDMHPPDYSRLRRFLPWLPRPAALLGGETLLAKIYEAVRTSATPGGSNYLNTLLIVTFDEHGGTYDHVPPPRVPPPDPSAPVGQMGFRFDRSGLRVPTLAISAWVDPRTVVNQEFRSTSVIRTLRERWSLGGPLTQRDAAAPDIAPILSRTTPRPAEEWPIVRARRPSRWARLLSPFERTLPALATHLFSAALALEAHQAGEAAPVDRMPLSRWGARRRVRGLRTVSFPRATQRHRG
jgi:phospholipase C